MDHISYAAAQHTLIGMRRDVADQRLARRARRARILARRATKAAGRSQRAAGRLAGYAVPLVGEAR